MTKLDEWKKLVSTDPYAYQQEGLVQEVMAELEEEIKRLSRTGVALHEAKHQIAAVEAQLAEAQKYLKEGESIAECLQRHRQDSGRAIRAMAEAQKDVARFEAIFTDIIDIDYLRWSVEFDSDSWRKVIDTAMESEK